MLLCQSKGDKSDGGQEVNEYIAKNITCMKRIQHHICFIKVINTFVILTALRKACKVVCTRRCSFMLTGIHLPCCFFHFIHVIHENEMDSISLY